jgi:hypothetical protein
VEVEASVAEDLVAEDSAEAGLVGEVVDLAEVIEVVVRAEELHLGGLARGGP